MPVTTSLLSPAPFSSFCFELQIRDSHLVFFCRGFYICSFLSLLHFQVPGRFYYGFPLAILCYFSIYCHFKWRQRCFPWRIFCLIPEHGVCFFLSLSLFSNSFFSYIPYLCVYQSSIFTHQIPKNFFTKTIVPILPMIYRQKLVFPRNISAMETPLSLAPLKTQPLNRILSTSVYFPVLFTFWSGHYHTPSQFIVELVQECHTMSRLACPK